MQRHFRTDPVTMIIQSKLKMIDFLTIILILSVPWI